MFYIEFASFIYRIGMDETKNWFICKVQQSETFCRFAVPGEFLV